MDKLQPLIAESVQLLFIGMGTVFLILIMLIFLITLISKLLASYEDEPLPVTFPSATRASNPSTTKNDDELIAVISSAIHSYRKHL